MQIEDRGGRPLAGTLVTVVAGLALLVTLVAGCTSADPARRASAPTASGAPLDPALARAVTGYRIYVSSQLAELVAGTKAFAAAVHTGDRVRARQLYPVVRAHYERVEPVAEIWGGLDLAIDGRADDFPSGTDFSGFHRLEQLLWTPGSARAVLAPAVPRADVRASDALTANVQRLQRRARSTRFTPLQMSSGATELLNEIEATKVTGEEEQYSHLDLIDITANVDGCERIVDLFGPFLRVHSPALLRTVGTRTARLRRILTQYRANPGFDRSGYVEYTRLSTAQRRTLSDDVAALAEAVSLTTDATSR